MTKSIRIVERHFWLDRIDAAWKRRSVLWLSGVRRVGKTVLCQSLPGIEYFDCELPRVRRMMEDPEGFLDSLRKKRIVLDEIHRLGNPSELLKIAADHYPDIRILATGSSTLGASAKFKDSLAGRKTELWLTPMVTADLEDFGCTDLKHRFRHGGLPPFFLEERIPERLFQEWMDAYWAKDIQELFRLEKRHSFMRFLELLYIRSGGIFEATSYARDCEASRGTISNYLSVLESTYIAHVLRPFNTRRSKEIVAAPKVYAFDTGFVCTWRGWSELRREDMGLLWEHFVLNELYARLQSRNIRYWRDKRGHEVDFVIARPGKPPLAIECKWSAAAFDATNLRSFRAEYPRGDSYVVAHDVKQPFLQTFGLLQVGFVSLSGLMEKLPGPI
jgi:predicted AAA+ superfamily ATPase